MRAILAGAVVAAAGGAAGAETIGFEGLDPSLYGQTFADGIVVGDYLFDANESLFLSAGGPTELGFPESASLSTSVSVLTMRRVDGQAFYLDGLVGAVVPFPGEEEGSNNVTASYEGAEDFTFVRDETTGPFAFEIDAFLEAVPSVTLGVGPDALATLAIDSLTVRLPAAVPLPASGTLLAFGLVGLATAYRRRG